MPDIKQLKLNALTVALESNMQFREFKNNCVKWTSFQYRYSMKSRVVLIPLKKEVIDAALNYKAVMTSLFPPLYPESFNRISGDYLIPGNKIGVIVDCLGNKQTIERVFMMIRQ